MEGPLEIRPPRRDETDALVDLMNALGQKLFGGDEMTRAELESWFSSPTVDLDRDARIALRGGRIVAYGDVGDQAEEHVRYWIDFRHDPRHPDEEAALALLEPLAARARETARPDARLRIYAAANDEFAAALAERAGFQPARYSYRMEVAFDAPPPAPELPPGISIRTYAEGDERRIYDVHMETFQDSLEFIRQPYDEWEHWMLGRLFDPTLWFLAEENGEIAGILLGRPHEIADPDLGWVNILGVRRPWRRRGLGRAILLHAFGDYYARGFRRVGLGVDIASPTRAVSLYESVGMKPVRQYVGYDRPL